MNKDDYPYSIKNRLRTFKLVENISEIGGKLTFCNQEYINYVYYINKNGLLCYQYISSEETPFDFFDEHKKSINIDPVSTIKSIQNSDILTSVRNVLKTFPVYEQIEKVGIDPLDLSPNSWNWCIGSTNTNNWFIPKHIYNSEDFNINLKFSANRIKSLTEIPLITYMLDQVQTHFLAAVTPSDRKDLFTAIDNQQSVSQPLQKAFDLEPWAVKKTIGLRIEDIVLTEFKQCNFQVIFDVFALLKNLGPDYFPQTAKQWETMRNGHYLLTSSSSRKDINQSSAFFRSLLRLSSKDKFDINELSNMHLGDVLHDFAENFVLGIVYHHTNNIKDYVDKRLKITRPDEYNELFLKDDYLLKIYNITSKILFTKRTYQQLKLLNDQWHQHHDQIHYTLNQHFPSSFGKSLSWLALTDNFTSTDNLSVVPLTTSDELEKEGKNLQHCVAGYDRRCCFENTHILSIRDHNNNSSSTFEINLSKLTSGNLNQPQMVINLKEMLVQHSSFKNAQPNEKDKKALDEWFDQTNVGNLKINWQALDQAKNERLKIAHDSGQFAQVYGNVIPQYDLSQPGALEMAWENYKPILSKPLRQLTFDQIKQVIITILEKENLADLKNNIDKNNVLDQQKTLNDLENSDVFTGDTYTLL